MIVNTMQVLYNTLTAESTASTRTIEDILTKDDEVELVMKDDSLHIKYQLLDNEMVVFDLTDNEGTYYFLDWANKFVKLEKADSAVFTNVRSYSPDEDISGQRRFLFLRNISS